MPLVQSDGEGGPENEAQAKGPAGMDHPHHLPRVLGRRVPTMREILSLALTCLNSEHTLVLIDGVQINDPIFP
jgi:hypothetical protein